MAKSKNVDSGAIVIGELKRDNAVFIVMGESPLIMERMSQKVKEGLLSPAPKKNATERQTSLKHAPLQEYRDSAYLAESNTNPTRLQMLSTAFKRSMATAALEIPGAKKSQIGRLTYVPGTHVDIYGLPKMLMSVVRSSDMNRTPDIRTRCIVPEWCAIVTVSFVSPQLRAQDVANLLGAAGQVVGVGGWRPEKGSGSFGRFTLTNNDKDKEYVRITKIGRVLQDKALESPTFFDKETEELFKWYEADAKRRGFKIVA